MPHVGQHAGAALCRSLLRAEAAIPWALQVRVCVIDSGLRRTHEDLAANVAGGWNRCGGEGRGLHAAQSVVQVAPAGAAGQVLSSRTSATARCTHAFSAAAMLAPAGL